MDQGRFLNGMFHYIYMFRGCIAQPSIW